MDVELRYAHSEGYTDVCYDDNGKCLLTCGMDGDIRVWNGFDDDDPITHHMGLKVTAIAFKEDMVYLATDSNAVLKYSYPDISCEGLTHQFSAGIYHIVCSKSGKFVAAGGGDFLLKVYDNVSKKLTTFRDHTAPIMSIAFDPHEKYIATSSCDGTVKLWLISDQQCLKTLKLFQKSNDIQLSSTMCRLQWQPNKGEVLAVPVDKELRFYERDSWNISFRLEDESILEIFSILAFSTCGLYCAAASVKGLISVWDVKKKKIIFRKQHPKDMQVCSLVWNPNIEKELAFCDLEGYLGVYDVLEKSSDAEGFLDAEALADEIDDMDDFGDDDDDFENIFDEPKKEDLPLHSTDSNHRMDDDDEDDENVFDIGAIKAKYESKILGEDSNDAAPIKSAQTSVVPEPKALPVAPVNHLQTSFQPSSTPLHLEHRFMLWNSVGIVRCYNTEDENSIDVEFHDANVNHAIHIDNSKGFTMAALSVEALLMASPKVDETASKLECLHFGTWDSSKEWNIDFPEHEDIEAIALGLGWAAVATDQRLIQVFTVSGVQCETFSCPGPVVSMAASGDQLAIVYHRGAGLPGEQNLGLMLMMVNLNSNSVCRDYPLPISTKSYLAWLGFTDEGHVTTVDTSGIVRILSSSGSTKWIPMANTKTHAKGKSDNYFVVGLSEIQQEIRCILCKGSRYPAILPRPTVTVLPFKLPFCDVATDKGRFEEEQARCALSYSTIKALINKEFDLDTELSSVERKWTDVLLKMFALATKTGRESRALDVAELMPNPKIVQGAIKYATQKHCMALAERLGEIVHKKMLKETQEEENEMFDDYKENYTTKSGLTNLSYLSSMSREAEEDRIQPKPLSMTRSSAILPFAVEASESHPSEDDDIPSTAEKRAAEVPQLSNHSPSVNPFKVNGRKSDASSSDQKKNNAPIDDKLTNSTKRLSSKGVHCASVSNEKQSSRQSKLSQHQKKSNSSKEANSSDVVVVPKKFGFALFLEQNKEKLSSENPDLEESHIIKMAMKLFKSLSTEEKEIYSKTREKASNEPKTKKRKLNSDPAKEDTNSDSKTSKYQIDLSKNKSLLSMFGFVKKDE